MKASQAVGSIIRVQRDRIRPFKDQPRSYFDPAGLKELARSIRAVGQQVPVTVRPLPDHPAYDYELVDGQRRWLACGQIGRNWMTAWVREDLVDADAQFIASVVANFSRDGHTHLEIGQAIARIRKTPDVRGLGRGAQTDHIADVFGRSVAWVNQHEALLSLAPGVQQLMHPSRAERDRLTFTIALLLTALPAKDQLELATVITDRRMREAGAKHLVRERLHALDGRPVGVSPEPRRVWDKCTGILTRVRDDLEVLVGGSLQHLRLAYEKRDGTERARLLQAIDETVEHLRELGQALRRLEQKRSA
jgi:ParB/RepB/Spo0J family partition protein